MTPLKLTLLAAVMCVGCGVQAQTYKHPKDPAYQFNNYGTTSVSATGLAYSDSGSIFYSGNVVSGYMYDKNDLPKSYIIDTLHIDSFSAHTRTIGVYDVDFKQLYRMKDSLQDLLDKRMSKYYKIKNPTINQIAGAGFDKFYYCGQIDMLKFILHIK